MKKVFRVVVSSLLLGGLLLAACSKEEKGKAGSNATLSSAPAPKVSSFQKTALAYAPEQSIAFFVWQGDHPAYEKLAKSPWGGTEQDWLNTIKESSPDWKNVEEVLVKAGFNPNDKESWKGLFANVAVFAAPSGDPSKRAALGVVLRPDAKVKAAEKFSKLKGELAKKSELDVQDVKVSSGNALSIRKKGAPDETEKLYAGWNDNVVVVATSDWALETVLSSKGDKLPSSLSSSQFTQAARGLPEDSARFATGFIDMSKLIETAEQFGPDGAASAQKLKSNEIPLKAISFAMGMSDAPETNVRFVYDPADKAKNNWLGALNTSSSSEILAVVPSKALALLTIDGQTLRKFREIAVAGMGEAAAAVQPKLAVLDHIKRIGLAVRAAAPGQTMLPVPDLMLIAESDKPETTEQQIQSLVGEVAKGSGMPGMKWKSETINSTSVQSMVTPFGIGVFLAAKGNLVLVASTDAQLRSVVGEEKAALFASTAPQRAGQVLAKEQSLGNLYLNFEELASLMESMGGMLSMYAPQGSDTSQFLQKENIEAMKKMGTVVGSIKLEDGIIGIDSFYEKTSKPAA